MIDIFSRKADIELLKRRDSPNVIEAMKKILKRMGSPEYILSDEGSEFISTQFKKLLKDNDIEQILHISHAPFAERLNRTIKEKLAMYLQATNTKTIVNALPKILNNYNNSPHKGINGLSPNEVNKDNEADVLEYMLTKKHIKTHPKLNVGDKVRVRLKEKGFSTKGYHPKYSRTTYEIESIDGMKYKVKGLDRIYLRAFIKQVQSYEENPEVFADLAGTREGQLKAIKKLRKTTHEAQEEVAPVATRTRNRGATQAVVKRISPAEDNMNKKIEKMNAQFIGKQFEDDDSTFTIKKIHYSKKYKDILADYVDNDTGEEHFSLFKEISEHF